MKNIKINKIGEWIEQSLRRMCGAMPPDVRVIVIVSALLFFAGLSIYFTVSGIYNFGKDKGEQRQMRHIERLKIELRQKQSELDSVKQINDFDYEPERTSE